MERHISIFIFLFIVIAANCWPILPDNNDYWKNQGDLFSNHRLQRFNISITSRDANEVTICLKDLKVMMERINRHNQKGFPFIGHTVVVINKLINSDLDKNWFNARLLEFIVNAIDGNRDNMSYHLLDGCYNWVTKRVEILYNTPISPDAYPASDLVKTKVTDQVLDIMRKNMTSIGQQILTIKDNLGSMNSVLVKSIKDMTSYVRDIRTYQDELKLIGMNMTNAYKSSNEIIHETDKVINDINIMIQGIKSV